MKKSIFTLLLLAFVCACALAPMATAMAEENDIALSMNSTLSGEDLTVQIDVTRNDGITGLVLELAYDNQELTLVGRTYGTALAEMDDQPMDKWEPVYRVAYTGTGPNCDGTGALLTLQFKVKEGAYNGKHKLTLSIVDLSYKATSGKQAESSKYDGKTGAVVAESEYIVTNGVPAPAAEGESHVLAIVLAVVGAVVVLAGASVAAYLIYRKKKNGSTDSKQ